MLIRFSSKLNRQIVGIPMGTTCAHLVADLFCFVMICTCLSDNNQADDIEALTRTNSKYLHVDDLLNINNLYLGTHG